MYRGRWRIKTYLSEWVRNLCKNQKIACRISQNYAVLRAFRPHRVPSINFLHSFPAFASCCNPIVALSVLQTGNRRIITTTRQYACPLLMEQTGRDQIQKNASDLEDSAQDMPPKVDCEAVGDGSNGDTKSGVNDVDNKTAVRTQKSVRWSEQLVSESTYVASDDSDTTSYTSGSNPYVSHSSSPSPSTSLKERIGGARNVLGRWGSNVREATKKAVDLAGNTWQHFKTSPSFADAAMGRVVHCTKVVAEGGYEKIFFQTFDTVPEESLQNSYACYLTTSAGPVMGTLYISTAKLAFCSDNPLPYKNGDQTEWSYYKVVIPLHQLKAVNPSSGRVNSAEKYIQIISVDNHEFWYMGFLNYNDAVTCLQEALQVQHLHSV